MIVLASVSPLKAGDLVEAPASPDSHQRNVARGLDRVFTDPATEETMIDLDAERLIIFSDHHKGTRDGADDFWRCERAYQAALGYYLEAGHRLFLLGDVEELWESPPEPVLKAYAATLALEAEFHSQGRYLRLFGNHDDQWRYQAEVDKHLGPIFPGLRVHEAMKLKIEKGGRSLGSIFLVHGHQGTSDAERYRWLSRFVVRYIWRPLQRRLNIATTTPAQDYELRQRHDRAMFAWARAHPSKPILIAGHTHRPIFGTSKPPTDIPRSPAEVEEELNALRASPSPAREALGELRAELEFLRAAERRLGPPPLPIDPPCYFNTGCCSFGDGDVTGLEIIEGQTRLVRWPNDEGEPEPKVLAPPADLERVLRAVSGETAG